MGIVIISRNRKIEKLLKSSPLKDLPILTLTNIGEDLSYLLKDKGLDYRVLILHLPLSRETIKGVIEGKKKGKELMELIVVDEDPSIQKAVTYIKQGAYTYLTPSDLPSKLLDEITGILSRKKEGGEDIHPLPLIGKSPPMKALMETIKQVAPTDTTCLIIGESGTGKELVARTIHMLSTRRHGRFVALNCGAFSEELIANELFGHERGAFTGATSLKKGLLEVARGGTIFLDEIGDMPLSMQVRLLRAIQEREILRVGGTEPIKIDVRFIAATHRDLEREVKEGRFRKDLFFRLNVITLTIPPLTERKTDIPLLIRHFIKIKSREMGKSIKGASKEVIQVLSNYPWPGNVRELENVIERAVALAQGQEIGTDLLPEYLQIYKIETYRRDSSHIPTLQEVERDYIEWVLNRCNGNKTRAAKVMGIDRVSLWRKLKRYNIG